VKLGFTPSTALMLDLEKAFRLAVECDMAFIEMGADLHEFEPRLQPVGKIQELCRATGVGTTVHLQYVDLNLCSLSQSARRTSVERILHGIEFAVALGASCGVVHTGLHYFRHPLADPRVAEGLHASLEALQAAPVPIVLENLALTSYDFVRGPQELLAITAQHRMQNCLDFGHANVERHQSWRDAAQHDEDLIRRYIDTLGERITHLHLHNNHGRRDEHLPTPQGTVDYTRYADFLVNFQGTICLEIATGEDGIRESVRHLRTLKEQAQ
jgi:sugar phosphate isomerase/epimerase